MVSDSQREELSLESLQRRFRDLERDMKKFQEHKEVGGILRVPKVEPYDESKGGRLQLPNWSQLIHSESANQTLPSVMVKQVSQAQPYQPRPAPPRRPFRAPTVLAKPRSSQMQGRRTFTPIGQSYTTLYEKLREAGMIEPIPGKLPYPLPASYDKNARCAYHSDFPGHDTEDCWRLKQKIETMIQAREIVVQDPVGHATAAVLYIPRMFKRGMMNQEAEDGRGEPIMKIRGIVPSMIKPAQVSTEPHSYVLEGPHRSFVTGLRSESGGYDGFVFKDKGKGKLEEMPSLDKGHGHDIFERLSQTLSDIHQQCIQNPQRQNKHSRGGWKERKFTPFRESYAVVFEKLRASGKLGMVAWKMPNPVPKNFNPNLRCAYHAESRGHDIEKCYALKKAIQELINSGQFHVNDF